MAYSSGMADLLTLSLALAVGAPARAMPANIRKGNTMSKTTNAQVTIKEVKALARTFDSEGKPHEYAQFFTGAKSLDDAGADAFTTGSGKVNYAAQLAGAALEWAWSGNDTGVRHLRIHANPVLTTARAKVSRVALAYVESIKPGAETFSTIADVDSRLNELWAEFLAILIPDSGKTKAKPTNWKQECLNARAERDAALSEVAAWKETADKLAAKLEHAQALATATATA